MAESKQVLMRSIIKKIEEFDNEYIHLKIFNILTDNMKLKNFSDNRNGIFFELNVFEYSKLKEIDNKLSYYRITSDNAKEINENREKLVDKMKKTVCSNSPREEEDLDEDLEENLQLKAYNDEAVSETSALSDGELFGDSTDSDCEET